MKKLILAVFLIGCGGTLDDASPADSPAVPWSGDPTTPVDPFECYLDDDACHCSIPENSADAIARSGERCNFLRNLYR